MDGSRLLNFVVECNATTSIYIYIYSSPMDGLGLGSWWPGSDQAMTHVVRLRSEGRPYQLHSPDRSVGWNNSVKQKHLFHNQILSLCEAILGFLLHTFVSFFVINFGFLCEAFFSKDHPDISNAHWSAIGRPPLPPGGVTLYRHILKNLHQIKPVNS